jgi:hypothetical protein
MNPDANRTNSTSQTLRGVSISTKRGKVRLRLIDTWQRPTLSAKTNRRGTGKRTVRGQYRKRDSDRRCGGMIFGDCKSHVRI